MQSRSIAIIHILTISTIVVDSNFFVVTAIERRPVQDVVTNNNVTGDSVTDDAVSGGQGAPLSCCNEYPWRNSTEPGDGSDQCRSPINILRQYVLEIDHLTTVRFVNYHKEIPFIMKKMRGQFDVEEGTLNQAQTLAIFPDPDQDLHVIRQVAEKPDAMFKLHFVNIHFYCSDHKFADRSDQKVELEAQFVHYDRQYGSLQEAMGHDEGVYIYSMTFEKRFEGQKSKYGRAIEIYSDIDNKRLGARWSDLIPLDGEPSYVYEYVGSLVSPPCASAVIWNIDYADKSFVEAGKRSSGQRKMSEKYVGVPVLDIFSTVWGSDSASSWCNSCSIPICRRAHLVANNAKLRRIRLVLGTPDESSTTPRGKIIAVILILIILIVCISAAVILKYV